MAFTACQCPTEDKCLMMLRQCVSLGVDWKKKDNLNQTPLFYASKMGYNRLIQVLVDNGFDVNTVDTYGQNAFYYAVNNC